MLGDESTEARLSTLERQMKRLLSDRSIGAALDGSFALKWPAKVMGPHGDMYVLIRQAGGVLSTIPIAEYSDDQWVDGAYWDWLPVGTVWPYTGSEDDIPTGWYLCDGENGTRDLRDKFILGGDFDTAGTTAAEQALVIAAHANHVVTQPSNHSTPTMGGSNTNVDIADTGTGTLVATSGHEHTVDPLSAHAGAAVDAHDAHTVSTPYYPAYYQLAFIEKVA